MAKYISYRPGFHLIFRKSFKTKNGKIIYAKSGKSFPIWVKNQ